jgi:branched-chain amino acid transport system substrate-binding protein
MKTKRSARVLLMIAIVAAAFYACRARTTEKASPASAAPSSVVIGWMGPLTGDAAPYGQAIRNGGLLALAQAKERVPGKGTAIQVLFEDDQAQPALGRTVFRSLLARIKTPVIVQAAGSSVMLANIPEAEKQKVVYISPSCSSDKIRDGGDFIFRTWPSDAYQAEFLAKVVRERLKARRAATFYINNDYGSGLATAFNATFKSLGGDVVLSEPLQPAGTDFRAQLLRLRNVTADVVFTPVHALEAARLIRQARELGLKQQIVADAVLYSPDFLKAAGSAANGMLISNLAWKPSSSSSGGAFSAAYRARFREDPDIYAAAGYDNMRIILQALAKSVNYSAPAIRDALYGVKDFDGVTGRISFDRNGEVHLPYELNQVIDGKFEVTP